MSEYDAIIIGAGHNGLVCAAYLAKSGLKVRLIEKNDVVGGAATTSEFFEGFKNSTCSYLANNISHKVIKDLDLYKFGLELLPMEAGVLSSLPNGRNLIINRDKENNHREISKFSAKDADQHDKFIEELDEIVEVVRELIESKPPSFKLNITELWGSLKFVNKLRPFLKKGHVEKLTNLMTMSLGDYLDSWFDSDELKGYYMGLGSIGNFSHPYSSGSSYILIHNRLGLAGSDKDLNLHVKGGMGNLTGAIAKSAQSYGAEISLEHDVKEVMIEDDVAIGIILQNGEEIKAKRIIANCTPYILFNKLLDNKKLPKRFAGRMDKLRSKSGSLKINVALSELPEFTSLAASENVEKLLKMPINICPSIKYMEKAYHDAKVSGMARRPFVSMILPSLVDDSLAPEGSHVASIFAQHFDYDLSEDLDWDIIRDEAADMVIETINELAPNFRSSILGMEVLSPKCLQTKFSLTNGGIYHGSMDLNQLFSLRPASGYSDYRTPIKNLYLCGAGTHPGGGVTGIPGRLSSVEILKDFVK